MSAAACLLALALQAAAQGPLAGFDPALEHADAVRAERAQLALDAWEGATDAQRAVAREILQRMRRSNAPAAAPPPLPAIHAAMSALRAQDEASEQAADVALAELAASLDVRATPGFFSAREEGEGELITVRVSRLWPARVESAVVVNLWWLASADLPPRAGGELARSEPATPAAFEDAGFDLFVRPPRSPASASWSLVVELVRGDSKALSLPVKVQCVGDAPAALGLARDTLEELGPNRPLGQALLASGLSGARLPVGLSTSQVVELLQSPPPLRPGTLPRPLELAFRESNGRERWIWAWMPVEPVQSALVLLAPQGEPPEAVLAGARGERWRAAARKLSALLISTPLPRPGAEGSSATEVLARVQAVVQGIAADLPIAMVARGDALDALHPALQAGARPCSVLIAATPREGEPRLDYGELPALILAPGGPDEITELPSGAAWVRGETLLWLDELRLPELAAQWFERAFARRAGGEQGKH